MTTFKCQETSDKYDIPIGESYNTRNKPWSLILSDISNNWARKNKKIREWGEIDSECKHKLPYKKISCCITWSQCNENYIWETETKQTKRVNMHKQQNKYPAHRNVPCCKHPDNCANRKINIHLFCKIQYENDLLRKAKE